MPQELALLLTTAASVGLIHTLLGPDHYLPFVVMARAGKWSTWKTTWITILCGIGHVGSSILLGLVGIALGFAVTHIEGIESVRGDIAGWALIAFGLVYGVWGLRRALRHKPHVHLHQHADGAAHAHTHVHADEHTHVHERAESPSMTPWILFTIFVFGPCEPLIPLVMVPAARGRLADVVSVSVVFSLVTIATMVAVVRAGVAGLSLLPMKHLERFSHALAGGTVLLCGVAIQFLGL
jgi:nickel/cobalt exporter